MSKYYSVMSCVLNSSRKYHASHMWWVEILTRHIANVWITGGYLMMWRVMSFLKTFLQLLHCLFLNLVDFKESFPYGVPCFLIMQKTSFHVAKGHVLQRESMPFALLKDVFCVAGLLLLPEPLWRHGHDNTIRHTIQRFFRQTGVSFCGLSERRARCA